MSDHPEKTDEALKTISEVCALLDVKTHTLRFWEARFDSIFPVRIKGRRYYRPEDVALLSQIKHLLYVRGFTIPGAMAHLKGETMQGEEDVKDLFGAPVPARKTRAKKPALKLVTQYDEPADETPKSDR